MRPYKLAAATILLATTSLVCGCRVESHKASSGDGDDVKIATPFGGMSVKTDGSKIAQNTGLPTYPGAIVENKKGKDGQHDGSADIDMSFGSFRLRVKAVSFHTTDSSDKVLEFYRKGLSRFGTVIQCKDHQPVGSPTRTPDGLDCSDDEANKNKVRVDDDLSGKMELKAGSKQHQHIVGIDPDGTGTKFALVSLDLPGHLSFGDKSKKDDDSDTDDGKQ